MTNSEILHLLILLLAVAGSVILSARGGIRRCPARGIPLLTWLIHSAAFSAARLAFAGSLLDTPALLLINSWSLSVRLHGVIAVVMVAVWELAARGRCER